MEKTQKTYFVEAIKPNTISKRDLEKIVEIEQDMWSREESFWEYVKCRECWKIHSKEDMFWELHDHIRMQTVARIEKIIPVSSLVCKECEWGVKSIFERSEYIEKVAERYFHKHQSFLSVYRDKNNEIRWFFDGFVDTFETIYEYEFAYYYGNIWKNIIEALVQEKTTTNNKLFLTCHGSWIEEKYRNLFILFEMQKNFFEQVWEDYGDIDAIYEVKVGTTVSVINALFWGESLWIAAHQEYKNLLRNSPYLRDIYFHAKIAPSFFEHLKLPIKNILKQSIRELKRGMTVRM